MIGARLGNSSKSGCNLPLFFSQLVGTPFVTTQKIPKKKKPLGIFYFFRLAETRRWRSEVSTLNSCNPPAEDTPRGPAIDTRQRVSNAVQMERQPAPVLDAPGQSRNAETRESVARALHSESKGQAPSGPTIPSPPFTGMPNDSTCCRSLSPPHPRGIFSGASP